MKQRFNIINLLIQHGANVNDINASGWNCLISAVNYFHEDNSILLLLLLQVYFFILISFSNFLFAIRLPCVFN